TDYEQYDYQNGYLYKISFNGTAVWQATTIDEYSRISAASIGATAATWGYSATTNMLSQIKGTGVQQYDYDFSGTTRNLTSRTNTLKSKTENFGYDTGNLDRLVSVTGTSAQNVWYDPTIKGNIASKTDVGTYTYNSTKKYALKTITNGFNISSTNQNIVYNAFNKVQTITEGTKTADFVYNADHQRIRMTLKTSGSTTKTRYYFGGSCEREVVGSTTTQYIWIGGDAYTAVAVATKVGTGSWTVYNIFRDHLGTITHLKNGSTIDEYSFDAWGRRRDKDDWSYTLTSEPALFADRGFTAHEFLSDFNLYNMNGRLYDPVVGRFLSPQLRVE
ncbi:MAG: RHS repeat-associated core domain-containing, partial [Prolixibacteraceae bacterium]